MGRIKNERVMEEEWGRKQKRGKTGGKWSQRCGNGKKRKVNEEVQKEKEGGAYVTQQSNYITRCQKHVAKQACWKEHNLIRNSDDEHVVDCMGDLVSLTTSDGHAVDNSTTKQPLNSQVTSSA